MADATISKERKRRAKLIGKSEDGNRWMALRPTHQWDSILTEQVAEDVCRAMDPSQLSKELSSCTSPAAGEGSGTTAEQLQIVALQAQLAMLAVKVQQQQQVLQAADTHMGNLIQEKAEAVTRAEAAEAEAAAARRAEAVALEAAAAAREAVAGQEEAQQAACELKLVRFKFQGRFYPTNKYFPIPDPIDIAWTMPPGCRLIEGVVHSWELGTILHQLEQMLDQQADQVKPITAGQKDRRRRQLKVDPAELEVATKYMIPALRQAKELNGRLQPREANILQSVPPCTQQERHWDFDPALVQLAQKKPAGVILALQPGTRMVVYHELLGRDVLVPVPPGCMLVFDGDVAHAGAWYACPNTRVHMYLDVFDCLRTVDVTWFERYFVKNTE